MKANNLKQLEKDLKFLAKRIKDFRYTDSALITFLMTGMLSITSNLFSVATDKNVENQKQQISSSIRDMRQKVKETRNENNKLLKDVNLELIQLMEQGDHVVKSPWSSWQFGINYFHNDYLGTYKGRGDKDEKYPYEGIFERSADTYERYVSPQSKNYSLLSQSTNPYSASSNNRQGLKGYGIASTTPVNEPIVAFEVSAGIRPKTVNKAPITIAAKSANVPNLPGAIGFVPPVVNLPTVTPPVINIPQIVPPGTANNDDTWIEGTGGAHSADVAPFHQINMNGGKMDVTVNGSSFGLTVTGSRLTGVKGAGTLYYYDTINGPASNATSVTYSGAAVSNPLTFSILNLGAGSGQYSAMKNVGGQTINLEGVTFNFSGNGIPSRYNQWLFHTDGHNEANGDSTWVLDPNSKVNITGSDLAMYTSQYHTNNWTNYGARNSYNIGFVNKGEITTDATNKNRYIWIALQEYGETQRVMYFDNRNKIELNGTGDTFAYVISPTYTDRFSGDWNANNYAQSHSGGFSIRNTGQIILNNNNQAGIVVPTLVNDYSDKGTNKAGKRSNYGGYEAAEIILDKPIEILGEESTGIAFLNWVDLDGSQNNTNARRFSDYLTTQASNQAVDFDNFSKESVLKVDLKGKKGVGLYFAHDSANGYGSHGTSYTDYGSPNDAFEVSNYTLNSINGENNSLIFVDKGKVILNAKSQGGNDNVLTISGGSDNIGIYKTNSATSDALITGATIKIENAKKSVGLYGEGAGANIENSGKITGTNLENSMGIVASGATTIKNTGEVDIQGTGVIGLVAKGGSAAVNSVSSNEKIKATGNSSAAVYTDAGTVNLEGGAITAEGGAIDLYSNGGMINVSNNNMQTLINTGQKSLAFMTANGGKINFASSTQATIAGGSDSTTRGTAFYYTPTSTPTVKLNGHNYGDFTSLGSDLNTAFNNNLGNLTLNMQNGSRLMIASNINASLTNTTDASIAVQLPGLNINPLGSYKTAMLYLSYLDVDKNVDLDNANDDYNKLEISNSSIENNSTITGTQVGQVAMAQENIYNNPVDVNWVTLTNNGTINLSGANSAAMYAKFGVINNTANIAVGDLSTGIYGIDNSRIGNTGTITIGSGSTGLYYDDARNGTVTIENLINNGTITSAGNNSVAMSYNHIGLNVTTFENTGTINFTGDQNTGMFATGNPGYNTKNSGTITMGNSASLNNPNVALYTDDVTNTTKLTNTGTIATGDNTIGIYGNQAENSGNITVGDGAIAIYSQQGNVDLNGGTIKLGGNEAVGVYTVGSSQIVTNNGTNFDIAGTSYGFVNVGSGNTINSIVPNITLGNDVVYIYSNDTAGVVTNSTNLLANGGENYGIYSAGTVTNTGNINFGTGTGNVGIYSIKGGTATNNSATITVGASNPGGNSYSIGMAAGYGTVDTGNVINNGTINVNGDYGIGMYASGDLGSGNKSTATNNGNIVLNGNNTIGIYADNGAEAINSGSITTGSGNYTNVVGVYLGKGSKLTNTSTGNIVINGSNSVGVYLKGGTVNNLGNITVNGSSNPADTIQEFSTPPTGKSVGGAAIDAPAGAQTATVTINGVQQTPVNITTFAQNPIEVSASSIGLYVNTSGKDYTNSINGLGNLTQEADLIIGTEATELTNSKSIVITDPKILNPYNNAIRTSGVSDWNIYSGGLTWLATPTLNPADGTMTSIYMVKIPYTAWAGNEDLPTAPEDTFNFLDGLEQRYGVEELGIRERELFQKLNSIGNNESVLFYQAVDEMMGHQYGNVQQRINETGEVLDKEFNYLRHDWRNPSKQNNKIKLFGQRNEFRTNTAGIIDYDSNAYGVAYVHEDETVKMGNSQGWYAGYVNNRFRLKDIGKSKETQNILKAGIFKTMSPAADHNGSLRWTIGGDVFIGQNEMERKFLVVDDIFEAKANYTSYGAALKTDLSYDMRLSERTHLRPYGALKMEYGRFNKIKEDDGQVRLEINGNDYFSVKPEVGVEFKYVQPLAVRTQLSAGLTAAYETELGKVNDVDNQGRVRYTSADWFGIRGEKENRKGNGKFDLNIGVDNTRFGVTVNAGYDTKGDNIRGGIGFRAIY